MVITTDTLQNLLATTTTETNISSSPDDLTTSSSDYAETPPVLLRLDSPLDCAISLNTSSTESLSSSDMDTPVTIPVEPYSEKVMHIILVGTLIWRMSIPSVALSHCPVFPIHQASLSYLELVALTFTSSKSAFLCILINTRVPLVTCM